MNPWKWLVLGWTAHKLIKLARALAKAKRLARRSIKKDLINKYDDL